MRRGGILPRILQSWWAPRRVVRGLSDMPERVKLIVLMADLTTYTYEPGIHRLATEGEAVCTKLWIEQRDQT